MTGPALRAAGPGRPSEGAHGRASNPAARFPTLAHGIKGVAFIDAAVRSSADIGRWVAL
ncbi:MAG: hypothetical protein ABI699_07325 [Caldimonas sp.]